MRRENWIGLLSAALLTSGVVWWLGCRSARAQVPTSAPKRAAAAESAPVAEPQSNPPSAPRIPQPVCKPQNPDSTVFLVNTRNVTLICVELPKREAGARLHVGTVHHLNCPTLAGLLDQAGDWSMLQQLAFERWCPAP